AYPSDVGSCCPVAVGGDGLAQRRDHDVLAALDVPVHLDKQVAAEPQIPHPAIVGGDAALGVVAVVHAELGVGLGQPVGGADHDGNAAIGGQLPGQDDGVRPELVHRNDVFARRTRARHEEAVEIGGHVT